MIKLMIANDIAIMNGGNEMKRKQVPVYGKKTGKRCLAAVLSLCLMASGLTVPVDASAKVSTPQAQMLLKMLQGNQ